MIWICLFWGEVERMTDRATAVQEIESLFSQAGYPDDFLADFDQLECLAFHHGWETFLVREKATQQLYVAKCYDASLFQEKDSCSILTRLHHEGLPSFYGSYRNDSMFVIVRSYIEGVPLSDYARDRALSQADVVRICVKLADIIIFLHSLTPPVIHRDIKPENIIVTEDENIVLIDFDIARTFKISEETDTVFWGTKGYAPPEQYGFTQTDRRSDIYSFGVLLRFLLTDSIRENSKIRMYRPLRRVIDRCTAFAPESRYSDMNQVKRALLSANPRAQAMRIAKISICAITAVGVLCFAGIKIYEKATYNPFTDGSVIPLVMPDEERQIKAVSYLQEKYGTHLFDDRAAYYTVGMMKNTMIELFGLDEDYVRIPNPAEPPQESEAHLLPWSLDDGQYMDRGDLAYYVTKAYWPEVAADWSSIRGNPEEYPGITVSLTWCKEHGILTGVNRPRDISCGEAAIAFANADQVFTELQAAQNKKT